MSGEPLLARAETAIIGSSAGYLVSFSNIAGEKQAKGSFQNCYSRLRKRVSLVLQADA